MYVCSLLIHFTCIPSRFTLTICQYVSLNGKYEVIPSINVDELISEAMKISQNKLIFNIKNFKIKS